MQSTRWGLGCLVALVIATGCGDDDDDKSGTRNNDDGGAGHGAQGGQGASGATGGGGSGATGGGGSGATGGGGAGGAPSGDVVLNEVAADGSPEDWVELKNVGTTDVDLESWTFTDDDPTHVYTFPAGTTIGAGEYLTVDRSGGGGGGPAPDEFDFGFSNDGDEAHLFDATGAEVDSTSWAVPVVDPATWARLPDGNGAFSLSAEGTKGAANE
jgi:hypothetical protein